MLPDFRRINLWSSLHFEGFPDPRGTRGVGYAVYIGTAVGSKGPGVC